MDTRLPPSERQLPAPHDMELPPPHDMLLRQPTWAERNTWIHWVPAIVGLFIGMMVGGVFIGDAKTATDQTTQQNITVLSKTPTIIPTQINETQKMMWQTYTNPQIPYTFQYPKSWTIKNQPSGAQVDIDLIIGTNHSSNLKYGPLDSNETMKYEIIVRRIPFLNDSSIRNTIINSRGFFDNQQKSLITISESIINGNIIYKTTSFPSFNGELNVYIKDDKNKQLVNFSLNPYNATTPYRLQQQVETDFTALLTSFKSTSTLSPTSTTVPTRTPISNNNQYVCTTDAKLCPNGSYVSRTGPRCTFPKCPVE